MLHGDPPPALVRLLAVRAAGSPLVVTAQIGELLAGGGLFRSGGAWALGPGALDAVPAAVRELVLGHLQRLTPRNAGCWSWWPWQEMPRRRLCSPMS
jgi:hypothetical protein